MQTVTHGAHLRDDEEVDRMFGTIRYFAEYETEPSLAVIRSKNLGAFATRRPLNPTDPYGGIAVVHHEHLPTPPDDGPGAKTFACAVNLVPLDQQSPDPILTYLAALASDRAWQCPICEVVGDNALTFVSGERGRLRRPLELEAFVEEALEAGATASARRLSVLCDERRP